MLKMAIKKIEHIMTGKTFEIGVDCVKKIIVEEYIDVYSDISTDIDEYQHKNMFIVIKSNGTILKIFWLDGWIVTYMEEK